jgi:hypothetical protein
MLQKDYWKKPDEELKRLAAKYRIPTEIGIYNDSLQVYDREKTINGLSARDSALGTRFAIILSILAFAVSVISLFVSFTWR